MPHENAERARNIFAEALRQPAGERARFVRERSGDDAQLREAVQDLLEAFEANAPRVLEPTRSVPPDASAAPAAAVAPVEKPGDQIGDYRLLELVGEGGFGSVWLAEQEEPVHRRVALKIIKLGMDTLQVISRFDAERQALAVMNHPHIAKVLDAGSTETGRPYFVMEYVEGVSILQYCDRERLDIAARLDLFMSVCHAIQHAHQKGIIHRDIKPSNVLVTLQDGVPVPQVIDFGIAKATSSELARLTVLTEHSQLIGTPAYMSPEQAGLNVLDVDTRADIYSLGVLLYELLTGTTPFDATSLTAAGVAEMMRVICEDDPPPPSARVTQLGESSQPIARDRGTQPGPLGSTLRGELDWIVTKCLEKERTRRYETANDLAADIQRHLEHEPVLAGPPSTGYRVRKFVRRNRTGVLVAATVALLLVLGLGGTTYGLLEANAARAEEARRAEELQRVADFQSQQLGAVVPELMGAHLRDTIIEAAPQETRGQLRTTLGRINFTTIGLGSLQTHVFDPALAAIARDFEDQPVVRAQLLQALAVTLRELGMLNSALQPQETALDLRRTTLGEDHPETFKSLLDLGLLLQAQGRLDDAERHLRQSLEGRRRVLGEDHRDTFTSIDNLGLLLQAKGELVDAEPYYRDALAGRRRLLGDDHEETLSSINNMGFLLKARGSYEAAEPYYRRAMEGFRRVLGNDHPNTLTAINNMGPLLRHLGKLDEAERFSRECMDGFRRVLGEDHPNTLISINNMGYLLKAQGKLADAEPCYRQAAAGFRRVLGAEHPGTLTALGNLGSLLQAQGKLDEARLHYRLALDGRRRVFGDEHERTLASINSLCGVLNAMERFAESEPLARESVQTGERVLGKDHLRVVDARGLLGEALCGLQRFAESERLLLEAHAFLDALPSEKRRERRLRIAAQRLVTLYEAWEKPAQAEEWRLKAGGAS